MLESAKASHKPLRQRGSNFGSAPNDPPTHPRHSTSVYLGRVSYRVHKTRGSPQWLPASLISERVAAVPQSSLRTVTSRQWSPRGFSILDSHNSPLPSSLAVQGPRYHISPKYLFAPDTVSPRFRTKAFSSKRQQGVLGGTQGRSVGGDTLSESEFPSTRIAHLPPFLTRNSAVSRLLLMFSRRVCTLESRLRQRRVHPACSGTAALLTTHSTDSPSPVLPCFARLRICNVTATTAANHRLGQHAKWAQKVSLIDQLCKALKTALDMSG